MLDERGVKWIPVAWNPKRETFYHAANGVGFCADEYTDGVKIYTDATITPEQAIAATLGAGTCHNVWDVELTGRLRFQCSECGAVSLEITPNYCPVCGRRVEQ
jgi:rubrerythrin